MVVDIGATASLCRGPAESRRLGGVAVTLLKPL